MKEREEIIITGLVVLMLILWLGFPFHVDSRFAGSLWGGVLAVSGALLMFVPLVYVIIKRVKFIKQSVTKKVSMRTLLSWHIYAGVLGPILVVLHTGHKFESVLGISLTLLTLVVVISGFVGRYLMMRINTEVKEKKATLAQLKITYDKTLIELRTCCSDKAEIIQPFGNFFTRIFSGWFFKFESYGNGPLPVATRAIRLTDAIADLEYAIRTHERFKQVFKKWLRFHIIISTILYILLALHVWSAVHFGLRWFA